MKPSDFRDFTPEGREQLRRVLIRAHHTAECWAHREDPGAACICRPPACVEPLRPTAVELGLAKGATR